MKAEHIVIGFFALLVLFTGYRLFWHASKQRRKLAKGYKSKVNNQNFSEDSLRQLEKLAAGSVVTILDKKHTLLSNTRYMHGGKVVRRRYALVRDDQKAWLEVRTPAGSGARAVLITTVQGVHPERDLAKRPPLDHSGYLQTPLQPLTLHYEQQNGLTGTLATVDYTHRSMPLDTLHLRLERWDREGGWKVRNCRILQPNEIQVERRSVLDQ